MQFKPLAVATAAAATLLCAGTANAVDIDFGADPASFGYVASVGVNTVFFDTFAFSLSTASTVDVAAGPIMNIRSGASWQLFEVGSPDDLLVGAWSLSPVSNPVLSLNAGSYYFTFAGKSTAAAGGGKYFLGGTVTAVPEPESYAMMLAGLAALGFVATRRRQG